MTFLDEALSTARVRVAPNTSDASKRAILAAVCYVRANHAEPLGLAHELADGIRGLRLAVENTAMRRAARPKPRPSGLLAAADRLNERHGHRPEKGDR